MGDITNFTELIDVNNNFDPVTGKFTIKYDDEEGVYVFHVSGHKSKGWEKKGMIKAFKNQQKVQEINEEDRDNTLGMNTVFTLHLQKGDEVKLGNMYDNSTHVASYAPLTFTGYKI